MKQGIVRAIAIGVRSAIASITRVLVQESFLKYRSFLVCYRSGFPANSAGRSTGVRVELFQIPCKSGWPSSSYGGDRGSYTAAFGWAAGACADKGTAGTAT